VLPEYELKKSNHGGHGAHGVKDFHVKTTMIMKNF
jgi:hypothetical protein